MTLPRPPLVLHVIHHLKMGGMENGLVNLLNLMPATHYRHAIACVEDYGDFRLRLQREDVEVVALNRSRVGVWRMRRALYDLCTRTQPAIVHSRNMSGLDALPPARLAGIKRCVHGEHGWDMGDLHGERLKPALLRRLHSPLIDRYVTVSKDLEKYLVARIGISPARITHICNGVDTERFAPGEKPLDLMPLDFYGPDKIVIGTVGRIQPVKNQAALVRAFAQLVGASAQFRARARLAIVGDGPLLEELRRLAASLGVAELTWLPGAHHDVANVLRAFDVFVLPSLSEGISNTILEAMATGLPVIASAVGGNPELVEDGRSGTLLEPEASDLAPTLMRYVDDPCLRRQLGAYSRKMAVTRYSLAAMVDQYVEVYERLLKG